MPRPGRSAFGVHHGVKWRGWYGLRSTIEAFNGYIKDPIHTDIEAPGLRRARGNTFAYLVATLVIVAANVRKIASFLTELHHGRPLTTKTKYETIDQVEVEELEMIETELLADGTQPPPR